MLPYSPADAGSRAKTTRAWTVPRYSSGIGRRDRSPVSSIWSPTLLRRRRRRSAIRSPPD